MGQLKKQGPQGDMGPQGIKGNNTKIEGTNKIVLRQLTLNDKLMSNVSDKMNVNNDLINKLPDVFVSNDNFNNVIAKSIINKSTQVSYLDNMNFLWCDYGEDNDECVPYPSMRLKQQGGLVVGNNMSVQRSLKLVQGRDRTGDENMVRMLNNFNIRIGIKDVFSGTKSEPIINGGKDDKTRFKKVLFHGDLNTDTLYIDSLNLNDNWILSKNNANDFAVVSPKGAIIINKESDFSK